MVFLLHGIAGTLAPHSHYQAADQLNTHSLIYLDTSLTFVTTLLLSGHVVLMLFCSSSHPISRLLTLPSSLPSSHCAGYNAIRIDIRKLLTANHRKVRWSRGIL